MNRLKNFLWNYPMRRILSPTIIFSLLLVFLSAWPGWGATYYIDPTCPSSGDGTTTTCGTHGPFKRWAEVTWTAGNTYSQKGGTTAYESITVGASGIAGKIITINSYGTGKAILNGRNDIRSSWTGPDKNGVYYMTAGSNYYLLEDGIFLRMATSKANLGVDGNFFDWHLSRDGKNYYKPTFSGPFPGNHSIEEVKPTGIRIGAHDYLTIDNISFTKWQYAVCAWQSAQGHGVNNITVTNCDFSNSQYGVYLFTWDATSTNIKVNNNTFDYLACSIELGMQKNDDGTVSNFTNSEIAYNTITHCSQVYTPSGPASYTCSPYGSTTHNWQCVSWYTDQEGIGTQNLQSSSIHHNTITGYCRGYVAYVGLKNGGYDNNIYSNFINTIQYPLVLTPNQSALSYYNNNVHHNILRTPLNYANEAIAVLSNVATPSTSYNYFYNNTVIAPDAGIRFGATADYWVVENNIIYGATWHNVLYDAAPKSHITYDYNLYYPSQTWYYYPGLKNWTTWKALGFDQHSPAPADPLFTNRSGTLSVPSDFTLQSTSPAKWAGVDVGLTTDYAGNPVHSPPSIGAYEYVGTPRPAAPTGLKIIRP